MLLQTYNDYELLILDDGSEDDTQQLIKSYHDKRINYIKHECNIGFVANWTYGVRHAKGDYLAILGDDDMYKPDFLLNRIVAFQSNPDIIAATGAFECCDFTGMPVRPSRLPCNSDKIFSGADLICLTLGFTGEWFNGATLYKAPVLQSLWSKIIFAGTALDLTMHIYLSLLPNAKIFFLTQGDMYLRAHPNQESIHNNLYLSESAALMAIKLWHFKIKPEKIFLPLFRKRFASTVNHYARILWDRNEVQISRSMFREALVINPYSLITWLKYLRSFIVNP